MILFDEHIFFCIKNFLFLSIFYLKLLWELFLWRPGKNLTKFLPVIPNYQDRISNQTFSKCPHFFHNHVFRYSNIVLQKNQSFYQASISVKQANYIELNIFYICSYSTFWSFVEWNDMLFRDTTREYQLLFPQRGFSSVPSIFH